MFRKAFCWPLLLILPWSAHAAGDSDLGSPQPLRCLAGERPEPPVFEPLENRPLTQAERRDLKDLFRRLAGDWRGTMEEQVCMLDGSARAYRSSSAVKARESGDDLTMRVEDRRAEGGARRVHKRSFHITPDGLRVDARSQQGDVEPLNIGDSGLAFRRRYRVLHERAAPTQQPSGAVSVQQVQEDGSVVTVQVPATSAEPATKRFSVTHEERYYLQLSGGNELTLTQQFLIQGDYSGSKTWRLQRD